jgi:hypothetical protein
MCPVCHSGNVSPSKRPKLFDFFMGMVGQKPLRCRECNSRFYVPARRLKDIKKHREWLADARETAERDAKSVRTPR